jgi:hypothetical protein
MTEKGPGSTTAWVPEGAQDALVWIIGVGDTDTKVERSIISYKKRPIQVT